ncbi:MAG: ABC transporter ATP-binding protein [Acidimicrobiia bacterium]|nr:ABC transporter ATP-binding protein [Acidimicrobiia bacterium]
MASPWHIAHSAMRGRDHLKGKSLDRCVMRRVWAFARPYRRMILGFLASIVLGSLIGILPPLIFRRIINAIPKHDYGAIDTLAAIAVGLALADAGLSVVQRLWSSRIGEGLIFDLRTALFDHVQRMPLAFFTRTQTGALVSRMNNDVVGAQQALTGTLGTVVSNVMDVTFTLVAMVALEWRLTLLALVVLPAFFIPSKWVGRRLQKITLEAFNLNAAMNATMTERFNVSGALLVKLFGSPERETDEFGTKAARVRDIGVKSALYTRTFVVALTLVGALGTALVYWLGARLVVQSTITIGTLVALALYVQRIYNPLISLTSARVDVMTAFVSFERVFEVLDAPRAIDDAPDARDLVQPTGRIDIDGVSFRYPAAADVSIASLEGDGQTPLGDQPSDWVLEDVSCSIEPGRMVALVGPTGAGKTTLSSLIPRLYDVTSGSVRLDGHDVRDLTLASVHAAVGTVTQDAHLFHDTVANNLRYARPDATDDELVAACRAARIHHVIDAMPDGYDTLVGERGYRLSGGEKQRLAIARVLLKAPAIVILDEATAHLDSETEILVQQALAEALAGRTSVVIAHRLSTIRAADEILVLDEGRIVERGPHDRLLAAGGLYAELYETQYGGSRVTVSDDFS